MASIDILYIVSMDLNGAMDQEAIANSKHFYVRVSMGVTADSIMEHKCARLSR